MSFSHKLASVALLLLLMCLGSAATAGARVEQIRARGSLICGVSDDVPGFSQRQPDGRFVGFEADLCRAIAAAMLGSAENVAFVPLHAVHEFLDQPSIDLVFHRLTWTLTREAPGQLEFGPVYFYDDPDPLPDSQPQEPLAPLLRSDDVDFTRIVRWTLYALIEAEALGAMGARGAIPAHWPSNTGAALGLPEDWARRCVAQVGDYGAIYQRHFADRPRGLNRLSRDGGLLFAPPLF